MRLYLQPDDFIWCTRVLEPCTPIWASYRAPPFEQKTNRDDGKDPVDDVIASVGCLPNSITKNVSQRLVYVHHGSGYSELVLFKTNTPRGYHKRVIS
ncbi:hypothetical protein KQX54_015362 [Cotesia glomerata]|uniref:Uncharacterized protein n=1 Tax=Cotesia glomerata TaxID=32391 RepID=A0AAV7IKJ3_COTGL|nr:hypothetical protein KQX54_015362 [Cotesia glomerata]